jgi:hypothetical protein
MMNISLLVIASSSYHKIPKRIIEGRNELEPVKQNQGGGQNALKKIDNI